MVKLATLFKAQKMLAHLSGTLISHRTAEIISSQLSNTRRDVMFVSVVVMWHVGTLSTSGTDELLTISKTISLHTQHHILY